MAMSAAVSVAAFSVVLAESFVAVAASTLVPATFLALARAIKAKANATAGTGTGTADDTGAANSMLTKAPGAKKIIEALKGIGGRLNDIDLLAPRTAKIHGEFTFEASESYTAGAAGGAAVNVVAVAAAYSALYSASSTNRITLDVDFAAVNYTLCVPRTTA